MTKKNTLAAACAALAFALGLWPAHAPRPEPERREEGRALESFEWWYSQRALPGDRIPDGAFLRAATYARTAFSRQKRIRTAPAWKSIGPTNVGGRVLSLAVDPHNRDIVWAGSASGGLWRSETRGIGPDAWDFVNTGFPSISVSTIAIDPSDPGRMYIGTGEISLYKRPLNGITGARASYGLGILRSTDAGTTWDTTSLTFPFPEITAVEKIVVNPRNGATLYAATSEGTYKSVDAGSHWSLVLPVLMAMDVALNPVDTNLVFAACGNYASSPEPGLYRSTDAGEHWSLLTNGIPSANFGRTALALSPSRPSTVYASVANAASSSLIGLYRSTDNGDSWSLRSATNYLGNQGWYANALAVHPSAPDTVYAGGLDLYQSLAGGGSLAQKSFWYHGYYGQVPAGGPEGPGTYVHADHHAIAFDPVDPNTVYFGCDGGVFRTTDGGRNFAGCNGGFVTTQFYPGFANSALDAPIALGGLQDNGVLKYTGSPVWSKVDDGDGGWCAINPVNTSLMVDEYVYLALSRSINGGTSFFSSTNGLPNGAAYANFIAPFVMSRSEPSVLYAGNKFVYKSTDAGVTWFPPNGQPNASLNGTNVSCIAVSRTSPDTLMAATGTGALGSGAEFEVFASADGGAHWTNVTGPLPDRYPTAICFSPSTSATAYITYSGYGTPHLFRTTDLGASWADAGQGLPDIPHQSVVVDPEEPSVLMVGTDLGVYRSSDDGATWEDFSDGLPPTMVMDLTFCAGNTAIRAATFGSGAFERSIPRAPVLTLTAPNGGELFAGGEHVMIEWTERYASGIGIELTPDGGGSWSSVSANEDAGTGGYLWTVPPITTGAGKIRVRDLQSGNVLDESDTTFGIEADPDIVRDWNLLSLGSLPPDPRPAVLFPSALTGAYAFDHGYVARDSVSVREGFWMKFPSLQEFPFSGAPVDADTFPLKRGWNIIGSLSNPLDVGAIQEDPPGIVVSELFGYRFGYFVTDSIRPRKGYWVKASGEGGLRMGAAPSPLHRRSAMTALESGMSSLTIECGASSQTLYFGMRAGDIDAARCELPPPSPHGTFDARFASNRMLELFDGNTKQSAPLSIRSQGREVVIRWNMRDAAGLSFALVVKGNNHAITGIGSMAIRGPDASDVMLQSGEGPATAAPAGFRLFQNYPNPFNPSTEIRYDLPAGGHVRLAVFDVAGREVALLADEMQEAGTHTVKWNAEGVSSGIYMCSLTAGEWSAGRKMIVLR